jgi:predicted DNA-binding transcriptional regulator YafY
MQIFDDLFYFQRIDHLIRTRATGSPDDLARRIGLSRRHLLRLISALREQGFPIAFDKCRNTYYYTESVKIRFEVIVGDDELFRIQGGTDYFFEKKFQSALFWH